MTDLPPWDQAISVRISLEGGVAYMPALAHSRPIELLDCDAGLREHVCDVLTQSARHGSDIVGSGDRRYFRIEITYTQADAVHTLSFKVPEALAPDSLRALWMRQR